jgi:hypothetical protein
MPAGGTSAEDARSLHRQARSGTCLHYGSPETRGQAACCGGTRRQRRPVSGTVRSPQRLNQTGLEKSLWQFEIAIGRCNMRWQK